MDLTLRAIVFRISRSRCRGDLSKSLIFHRSNCQFPPSPVIAYAQQHDRRLLISWHSSAGRGGGGAQSHGLCTHRSYYYRGQREVWVKLILNFIVQEPRFSVCLGTRHKSGITQQHCYYYFDSRCLLGYKKKKKKS